jgi:hypothetical protein
MDAIGLKTAKAIFKESKNVSISSRKKIQGNGESQVPFFHRRPQ